MAEIKKYLDNLALGTLVDQVKAKDAKTLQAAKDYCDSKDKLFDAAGAAATVQSKLDEEVARAKAAEEANTAAAKKAQDEVDALELVVQNIQENAYDDTEVRNLISGLDTNKADKTQVATDIADAVKVEEDARKEAVAGVQGAVDTLAGTHATDKKALEDAIALKADQTALDAVSAIANAAATKEELTAEENRAKGEESRIEGLVTAEAERAAGVESGLETRIKAVEDDYLKAADKTELQGKIDEKAAQTALDAEIERATGVEASLQTQINTIMNNPDAEGAINSINEFTQYVTEHGEIADGFRTDINKNKEDIAAEVNRAGEAEAALAGRLDTLEAIDHEAYVAADTALENKLNAEIPKKADATALAEAVEALEGADAGQVERIAALEAKFTGEDSVEDMVADAKQEAIDAAAQDATSKANKALEDAKAYADAEDAKIEERVATLEGASATHALKSDVEALTGRVTTAEGEIDTLQTEMDAVEAKAAANETAIGTINTELAKKAAQADLEAAVERIAVNEGAISTLNETVAEKAEQDDLDAAVARIAANETAIAANTSAINSFTAITPAEVEAMFA